MLLASTLIASFLIASLSAWQLLKGSATRGTHEAFRAAIFVAAAAMPVQFLAGDAHGLNTLEYQPAKVTAMEDIWETERGAPLTLFGISDEVERTTHFAIKIPKFASLVLTHDLDSEIKGLNEFKGSHPPVAPVFYAFRVMVGVGTLMLLVAGFTAWRLWRQRRAAQVSLPRTHLWVLSGMAFSGWVATLSGWYVTEIGRQPYLVYSLMRTSEAATTVPPPCIALTLTAYLIVYGLLLVTYVGVLKYMAEHPKEHAPEASRGAVLGKAGV